MKKHILFFSLIIVSLLSHAQSPQGFKYQAVIRNTNGTPLESQAVSFRVSVLFGSSSGEEAYIETHNQTTSSLGLVNLVIGKGEVVSGTFQEINWAQNDFFLQLEIDKEGGENFQLMGTTQLLSVPYALHAETVTEKQTLSIEGSVLSISGGNEVELPQAGSSSSTLMLTGDISDEAAAELIATMDVISHIYIGNTSNLSTVDLSSVSSAVEISIFNNSSLSNVNLSGLSTVFSNLIIRDSPVTELNLTKLEIVGGANILHSNSFSITNTNLSSLNLGSYKSGNLIVSKNPSLSSIDLSSLSDFTSLDLTSNALTSDAVNSILANLVLIDPPLTDTYISLQDQNPEAPPSGQGLTDLQTLRSNSNTLNVDNMFVDLLTRGPATFSGLWEYPSGGNDLDWSSFQLTFSGTAQEGGTFITSGVPSGAEEIWPSAGQWTLGDNENELVRSNDGLVMTIKNLSENGYRIFLDIPSTSARQLAGEVLVLSGTWEFSLKF